jgi:peptide/nickel transport system substrate-binding protein
LARLALMPLLRRCYRQSRVQRAPTPDQPYHLTWARRLPWPFRGLPWPFRGLPWPFRGLPWPSRGLPWPSRGARAILLFILAACGPTPVPPPSTSPAPILIASATRPIATPAPATPSAVAPPTPTLSPTPTGPRDLTICLAGEPESLYRYARPEANRDHILAALYDGPIDSANYGFQPVLFDKLPSLANGDAVIRTAKVISGQIVVDALGRVLPLAPGLRLRQLDGTIIAYDGGPDGVPLPQMVVSFHLRPGLLWSDGVPLTAGDSVFAFDVARSPDSFDPMRDAAERTASYDAPDPATIVWTSLPGDLDPLYATNFWPPLPRHQLGSLDPAQIAASDLAKRAPLGWGPFMIQDWQPGQRLVVQRNPNYWRAVEGLPRLGQVTYRFGAALADLASGLRDGTCDIVPSGAATDQAAAALQAAAQAGFVTLQTVPGVTLEHLDFNLAPSPIYTGTAQSGLFQDLRVRQPFADCLDRQSLQPGSAVPAAYLPPGHPLSAVLQPYPFDPAQGRALLAQVGWTDTNGDGVIDKGGVALTLTLAGDEAHQPLMQALQNQLGQNCGVGLRLQTLTQSELAGDWPDGVIFGRRFDLAVFAWRVGAVPPCELFTTAEIASAGNPGGANDSGYSNPAFDVACQQALFPLDQSAGAQRQAEAQRQFARDLPVLPLFFEPRRGAARPSVQGYTLDPSSPSELSNIEIIDRTTQ